jgi:uncharacterized YigZ family protein
MTQPLQYRTVKQYGETEIIIQKSRFITYVNRVESEEEAANFVQEITRRHWIATHNCYAWVVGRNGEVQRSSDDGEPAGTAGRPILEVIRARNLVDTAVVVTRYFGGIKLGAGGLIRAYSQSASAGLDEAGVVIRQLHRAMEVTLDYSQMGKVEHALRTAGYDTDPPRFTDKVRWTVWIPVGEEKSFIKRFAEITGGQGTVTEGAIDYRERED